MRWTDETIPAIRRTAKEALDAGKPAPAALRAAYGVSQATADRWLQSLRRDGLIPYRTVSSATKIKLVANALKISPEDLERAIVQLADGDLRVPHRRYRQTHD